MVKLNINAYLSDSSTDCAEYQVLKIKTKTKEIHLVNYYCPNNINLDLLNIPLASNNFIIVRDFNSHSQSWGYNHIDARGEEWQDDNNLILINKPEDTPTFYSRCWHTTSTPNIAICTEDIHSITKRTVGSQLGGSDHKTCILDSRYKAYNSFNNAEMELQEGRLERLLTSQQHTDKQHTDI